MFKETTEVSAITQKEKVKEDKEEEEKGRKKLKKKTRGFPRDLHIGHSAA
jgi:hypothetical protein